MSARSHSAKAYIPDNNNFDIVASHRIAAADRRLALAQSGNVAPRSYVRGNPKSPQPTHKL
ncbi:hypothetical protein [Ferrimicrobium acidiphilum]|uniref:hypothetical protein n=1 Tax=Ferrimicrobium acidiphilum TaxID=121039 RepID=UPI00126A33C9|nr:hypothetical protein [Ferrimicrobium acidiphilum]